MWHVPIRSNQSISRTHHTSQSFDSLARMWTRLYKHSHASQDLREQASLITMLCFASSLQKSESLVPSRLTCSSQEAAPGEASMLSSDWPQWFDLIAQLNFFSHCRVRQNCQVFVQLVLLWCTCRMLHRTFIQACCDLKAESSRTARLGHGGTTWNLWRGWSSNPWTLTKETRC